MRLAAVLCFLAIVPCAVQADVPGSFNYQGLALDPNGLPLNGSFPFTFRLFDASVNGTELWIEGHPAETVVDGVFSVTLGETTALTQGLLASPELWLEVTLDVETLSPRQRIVAVPYALRAAEAEQLTLVCSNGDALRFESGQWVCGGAAGCASGDVLTCYTGAPATLNVGACQQGQRTCDANGDFAAACAGEVLPATESCCDGIDNNCDGTLDDGCGQPNASTCACTTECLSGFCVDGVCCDTPCTGACETCAAGTCGTFPVANGSTCACDTQCLSGFCVDGICCDTACSGECVGCASGTCTNRPAGELCGTPGQCHTNGPALNNATPDDHCDGAGTCLDPPDQFCDPYLCMNAQCFTTCTSTLECNAFTYCDTATSQCISRGAEGEPCTSDEQCFSPLQCINNLCTAI